MSIRNAGESAKMKVKTINKINEIRKNMYLVIPHYA